MWKTGMPVSKSLNRTLMKKGEGRLVVVSPI